MHTICINIRKFTRCKTDRVEKKKKKKKNCKRKCKPKLVVIQMHCNMQWCYKFQRIILIVTEHSIVVTQNNLANDIIYTTLLLWIDASMKLFLMRNTNKLHSWNTNNAIGVMIIFLLVFRCIFDTIHLRLFAYVLSLHMKEMDQVPSDKWLWIKYQIARQTIKRYLIQQN